MAVNDEIKRYIVANGFKQTHIASQAGISIQAFNAICNGKQRILAEQYFAICNALNVPLSTFAPNGEQQK